MRVAAERRAFDARIGNGGHDRGGGWIGYASGDCLPPDDRSDGPIHGPKVNPQPKANLFATSTEKGRPDVSEEASSGGQASGNSGASQVALNAQRPKLSDPLPNNKDDVAPPNQISIIGKPTSKPMSISAIQRRCVLVAEKGWVAALAAERNAPPEVDETKTTIDEENILIQQADERCDWRRSSPRQRSSELAADVSGAPSCPRLIKPAYLATNTTRSPTA